METTNSISSLSPKDAAKRAWYIKKCPLLTDSEMANLTQTVDGKLTIDLDTFKQALKDRSNL